MEKGTSSRASSGSLYEVFLNFRGVDTRHGFTDFLYREMVGAGILVFRDSESLHVGEEIGAELLQAIENSKIYIPIFSANYASSCWCLRELAYMVECTLKSNGNKEILPIFLDVEPTDVKLKTNLYKETLSKRQKTLCSEVESWQKALIAVGKIKGWNLKKDESQANLIQSVTKAVLVKLNVRYKNVTEHLVGVDDRVEAIIKMLNVESDDVKFLTIHGMGGVGKTTLTKVVFNRLSSRFQGCNFLSDVRESSERHGLVHLQKQLLSKFLDHCYVDQISDVDYGIDMIKRVLHNKKVLIVLDDVDENKQMKNLAEKGNWFGSGSRIIITTRYKSVLMIDGEATSEDPIKCANVLTYEVQEMEFRHALELFIRHAFRRDCPPDDYVDLSEKVVSTLGKLPLALEVTGSSLSGRSKEFWVDTLKKLEKAPSMEVQKTLMITYERLDDAQRQVFLDITCFFVNEDKTYPCYMWEDCEYHPYNAIEILYHMSLIKIKHDNTFWMHDQVRDLGRAIVCEENFKEPHKRSRVWNHKEALSILEQKKGSKKIEALSLGSHGVIIMPSEVAKLRHLRFLDGNEMFFVGDFNNLLSNLRWLSWRWCPFEFVATNFHLVNLIVLDLSHSYVSEKWIGWNQIRVASKLKVLDLSNCNDLTRMPDLSMLLLTALNLNGCDALEGLPYEIGCLDALTEILIPRLSYAFKLPETIGNLKSLLTLDVSHSWIRMLPNSIGGLVKLRRLNLSKCFKIKKLPDSVGQLQSLVELDLSSTSLGHLPDSIGNLKQLTVLRMSHIIGITKLPREIGLLEKLEELEASGCHHLTGEIPEEIGRLSLLRILDLSFTRISRLPITVYYLSNLQTLNLESCYKLNELPQLPPSLSCLRWTFDTLKFCGNRTYMPEGDSAYHPSIVPLHEVEELAFGKTRRFWPQLLPSSLREFEVGNLGSRLLFSEASKDDAITKRGKGSMEQIKYVGIVSIANERIETFRDAYVRVLLKSTSSTAHEDSGRELGSLCFLSIVDCSSMERMSNLSKLRKLRKLRVGECPKLKSVEGLNHLESLQKLWIHNCCSLESLADTSNLRLECSTIEHCERLPNSNSYCRCHDNRDSVFTDPDHASITDMLIICARTDMSMPG
ncbi:disease resistance protein L6-like [Rutidosis leptorrhynchoides]|uniref:disease resistance protein L6-like n=1 Tax=Rutidosis leptorrhynchoides TaxID=125765 RepID=UPI003A98F7D2